MIAGALLFIGAEETADWFSWTIEPPLTAAFLGGVYWAAAVLFWHTSGLSGWAALRTAAAAEAVAAAGLLVATLIHLDKFHHDLFGYFWITVYAIAAPVIVRARGRALASPPPAGPGRAAAQRRPSRRCRRAGGRPGRLRDPAVRGARHLRRALALGADAAHRAGRRVVPARDRGGARPRRPRGAARGRDRLCRPRRPRAAGRPAPRDDFTSTAAGIAFALFFAAVGIAGAVGARGLPQSRTSASARSGS